MSKLYPQATCTWIVIAALLILSQSVFTTQPKCPYVGKQIKTVVHQKMLKKTKQILCHEKMRKAPVHIIQ